MSSKDIDTLLEAAIAKALGVDIASPVAPAPLSRLVERPADSVPPLVITARYSRVAEPAHA